MAHNLDCSGLLCPVDIVEDENFPCISAFLWPWEEAA